jgi:hypothetical protein
MIIEHDHLSTFDKSEDFCALQPCPVPKPLNLPGVSTLSALNTFGHGWPDASQA